ncbi:MAG: NADH-quinone oxidoreductase subunit D [Phycisphaera sp.]|nr:NADH-quinone oxidoreductase subunit D [Phycisphaera sp.]
MPYQLEPLDVNCETTPYLEDTPEGAEDQWTLNFGPQHPSTHTTLRIVVKLDGERVARAVPHIGYLHSGFEKLGEKHDYNQYVTVTDRMNYLSPIANNIVWHHAVEKLFDIEITPRCKVLRTIMAEMARIQDHLLCVGAAALDLGAFTAFLYGFNEREKIYDICEYICGARFTTSWTRVGGLNQDLPDEEMFKAKVKKFIVDELPNVIADLEGLLNKNRIFIDRTAGIGTITAEEAIAWSVSGPLARAAGVKRDLRKDDPYLCYAENWDGQGADPVEFKVPIMHEGDVYCRFRVRVEEIKQSMIIIRQLIDKIPGGSVNAYADEAVHIPDKKETYGSIEGLIHHFELIMTNRKWKAPIGETYGAQETSNGELGFYLVADGGPTPWRARCRPPSFINYTVFPKMMEGHLLSDIVAVLGSLNVIAAELDR